MQTVKAAQQKIAFCRSADGTSIAYAVSGSGPVLMIAACWLSHLQYDWESPVWRHFLGDVGRFATIVRYDERGFGLSDRDVTDFSLEARVADLEAVIEHADLDRFALLGMAQGGPVTIEYAARHPERVTRMLFYGSYSGAREGATDEDNERLNAFAQLMKVGLDRPGSEFRRVLSSLMIPNGTREQMAWLDELLRVSTNGDIASRASLQRSYANATDRLPGLRMPALVLHARGDRMNEFAHGRRLATDIPDARLVALESDNHIVLADEPAWAVFVDEVERFLQPDTVGASAPLPDLSPRELDVLRLVAQGRDNDDIAAALHLSARTVERHLQNVYGKLGVSGRSARAAAVARLLGAAANA